MSRGSFETRLDSYRAVSLSEPGSTNKRTSSVDCLIPRNI